MVDMPYNAGYMIYIEPSKFVRLCKNCINEIKRVLDNELRRLIATKAKRRVLTKSTVSKVFTR